MRSSKFFGVLLATISVQASAQTISIFGFELGRPLNLPECVFKTVAGMKLYEVIQPATCAESATTINGYKQPVRRIVFSQAETPTIVKNWNAIPLEVDGNLVGLHFFTPGASAQQLALDQLTSKFGKPTARKSYPVQNVMGAKFDAISAQWRSPSVQIAFEGIRDKIDTGEIYIDLPTAADLRRSWQAETTARKL